MINLNIMILCRSSAWQIYVANRLCRSTRPMAFITEVDRQWGENKVLNLMKPWILWRKIYRKLIEKNRHAAKPEAKYLFLSNFSVLNEKS